MHQPGPLQAQDPRAGSVLIVAILLMTALLFFGVEFLAHDSIVQQTQDAAAKRLQTRTLAQAGLDHGQRLLQAGAGSGESWDITVGATGYQVDISQSGGIYEVTSLSKVDGIHSEWVASYTVSGGTYLGSLMSGGDLKVRSGMMGGPSTLTVEGPGTVVGGVDEATGSSIDGDFTLDPALGPLAFDAEAFQASADRVLDGTKFGGAHLGPGNDSGIVFVDGDVTVWQPFTFKGTVFATGNITIVGTLGFGSIQMEAADGQSAVIAAGGRVSVASLETFVAVGHVLAEGEVVFVDVDDASITGALTSNTEIDIANRSHVTLKYASSADVVPTWVTGAPAGGPIVVSEVSRRSVPSSSASEPAVVDPGNEAQAASQPLDGSQRAANSASKKKQ